MSYIWATQDCKVPGVYKYYKVDWMLESFPRGPSTTECVHASSVNMFKNKIDKYLVKAGHT